jgi:hypothetical protein
MHFLGPDCPGIEYRLPAIVAGVGAVGLAGWTARRQEVVDVLTAMLLMGSSFLCIHYSSEARGYNYVVFFSLLAFILMERSLARRHWINNFLFSVTAVLGILSHLTFIYCFAALGLWSLFRLWKTGYGWISMARCFVLPVAFVLWLYVTDIWDMEVGGGTVVPLDELMVRTLSLALGGPESGSLAWVTASASVAVLRCCGVAGRTATAVANVV